MSSTNPIDDDEAKKRKNLLILWLMGKEHRVKIKHEAIERTLNNPLHRYKNTSDINVYEITFGYQKKPLKVIESKMSLNTETPWFSAVARVTIPPLEKNTSLLLGWVQALTSTLGISQYGKEGCQSGEMPNLINGKVSMVNDGEGREDAYPWYDFDSVMFLKGPTKHITRATISMVDAPGCKVTWSIPAEGYSDLARLTYCYRKIRFYTHLVLFDPILKKATVLKKFTWGVEYGVDVDTKKKLGNRARLIGPCVLEKPVLMPPQSAPTLVPAGLSPPVCNNAAVNIWRPTNADPSVKTHNHYTKEEMKIYLRLFRDYGFELQKYNKKSFLLLQQDLLNTHKILNGRGVEDRGDNA